MRLRPLLSRLLFTLLIGVFLSFSGVQQANSQEMTRVPALRAAIIDKFGVCRIVRNIGLTAMMVPHKSAGEWALGTKSFLAAARPNTFLEFCPVLTTGDPMPDPNVPPLSGGGTIAVTDVSHPVFRHFQKCFGFGTGAFFLDKTTCVLNAAFWDTVRNEMCKPSAAAISVSMGGFVWTAAGNSCAVAGSFDFYEAARNSTCRPSMCVADVGGSCVFTCS